MARFSNYFKKVAWFFHTKFQAFLCLQNHIRAMGNEFDCKTKFWQIKPIEPIKIFWKFKWVTPMFFTALVGRKIAILARFGLLLAFLELDHEQIHMPEKGFEPFWNLLLNFTNFPWNQIKESCTTQFYKIFRENKSRISLLVLNFTKFSNKTNQNKL